MNIRGPIGIINHRTKPNEDEIKIAASFVLNFTNKTENTQKVSYGKNYELVNSIEVTKPDIDFVESCWIKTK